MSRQSPRIPARFAATVEIAGIDHTIVCHTRDISTEGCFLDTSEQIASGVELSIAIMDNVLGEVVEAQGEVTRLVDENDVGTGRGVGVKLIDPPIGWTAMVERYEQSDGEEGQHAIRLRVLVVGDEDRKRGALALYVKSGWDLRFATELENAREALYSVELDAVIAEHDLTDQRWAEVLATARRIQPTARRLVRTSLKGGEMPTHGGKDDLVHRVVDLDSGLDALVDALTADIGIDEAQPFEESLDIEIGEATDPPDETAT
ncbi:MAG: PilZ domain-containing protein [Deltaproteobacteria bacterium]|nr:PilZ domain-containing protein [Deltaproteobacteria bacterium]